MRQAPSSSSEATTAGDRGGGQLTRAGSGCAPNGLGLGREGKEKPPSSPKLILTACGCSRTGAACMRWAVFQCSVGICGNSLHAPRWRPVPLLPPPPPAASTLCRQLSSRPERRLISGNISGQPTFLPSAHNPCDRSLVGGDCAQALALLPEGGVLAVCGAVRHTGVPLSSASSAMADDTHAGWSSKNEAFSGTASDGLPAAGAERRSAPHALLLLLLPLLPPLGHGRLRALLADCGPFRAGREGGIEVGVQARCRAAYEG